MSAVWFCIKHFARSVKAHQSRAWEKTRQGMFPLRTYHGSFWFSFISHQVCSWQDPGQKVSPLWLAMRRLYWPICTGTVHKCTRHNWTKDCVPYINVKIYCMYPLLPLNCLPQNKRNCSMRWFFSMSRIILCFRLKKGYMSWAVHQLEKHLQFLQLSAFSSQTLTPQLQHVPITVVHNVCLCCHACASQQHQKNKWRIWQTVIHAGRQQADDNASAQSEKPILSLDSVSHTSTHSRPSSNGPFKPGLYKAQKWLSGITFVLTFGSTCAWQFLSTTGDLSTINLILHDFRIKSTGNPASNGDRWPLRLGRTDGRMASFHFALPNYYDRQVLFVCLSSCLPVCQLELQ